MVLGVGRRPPASLSTYGVRSKYDVVAVSPCGPGSSGNAHRTGCDVENTNRPPGRSTRAASASTAPLSATNGTTP